MAAGYAEILDIPCASDSGLKYHRALRTSSSGNGRIYRDCLLHEKSGDNVGRDVDHGPRVWPHNGMPALVAEEVVAACRTAVGICPISDVDGWKCLRPFDHRDMNGNLGRSEDVSSFHLALNQSGVLKAGWGIGLRRRGCGGFHEIRKHLPRERLRVNEWNQHQRDKDGCVEGEGRDDPATAASAECSVGFEGGVFKHGLPPCCRIQF